MEKEKWYNVKKSLDVAFILSGYLLFLLKITTSIPNICRQMVSNYYTVCLSGLITPMIRKVYIGLPV